MKSPDAVIRELRDQIDERDEKIRQLEAMLIPRVSFPERWGLTPAEALILSYLLAASPGWRSRQDILETYSAITRREPGETLVNVYIHRLRGKLASDNISIESMRGCGYFLSRAAGDMVRAFAADEGHGPLVMSFSNRIHGALACSTRRMSHAEA